MATIKAFCALRPDPAFADRLIFPDSRGPADRTDKRLSLRPLKEQLEAPARRRPETPAGQDRAYQEINKSMVILRQMRLLLRDSVPGVYIYETGHPGYRQTGIWALTAVQDYLDGHIRLHEQTLTESARRISNYHRQTGLEGSPILLTYPPEAMISHLILGACTGRPDIQIHDRQHTHRLWKIEAGETLDALTAAFAKIPAAYLTDGHHRLAAAAAQEQEAFISSMYIPADQVRIIDYHRVVLPGQPVNAAHFLQRLSTVCTMPPQPADVPFRPASRGTIGMWLAGRWYELVLNDSSMPDVVSLQEQILEPLLDIRDPRTDPRLRCIGGEYALKEMEALLNTEPHAIVFLLRPMTVDELMGAADQGQLLPPKSTWTDPKVPYGLLMYRQENDNEQ